MPYGMSLSFSQSASTGLLWHHFGRGFLVRSHRDDGDAVYRWLQYNQRLDYSFLDECIRKLFAIELRISIF